MLQRFFQPFLSCHHSGILLSRFFSLLVCGDHGVGQPWSLSVCVWSDARARRLSSALESGCGFLDLGE